MYYTVYSNHAFFQDLSKNGSTLVKEQKKKTFISSTDKQHGNVSLMLIVLHLAVLLVQS